MISLVNQHALLFDRTNQNLISGKSSWYSKYGFFKAIEKDDLRYWGNDSYPDDSSVFYRYDSFVANHKNVKDGDIITNRENILGISVIEKLETQSINKKRNKCINLDCKAKKFFKGKL
ncbi:hypothetical protein [Escherichia coli]|uniref:hypothetical protein n=1 Tax=Escherichia coli TaxID=562 RepID=UPI0033013072|nr:hypothetical protein [Escherichia coli]